MPTSLKKYPNSFVGIASGEIVEKATRPSFSLFVGATPQNDDDDELYDDADVTEDDFAEFDIDDDEEPVIKKVRLYFINIGDDLNVIFETIRSCALAKLI